MSQKIKLLNVGFPKAGNTWLGRTLSYALNAEFREYDIDGKKLVDTYDQDIAWRIGGNLNNRKKTDVDIVEKTHLLPNEWKNHNQDKGIKAIYIERDPRDIAISYFNYIYHHRAFVETGKFKDYSYFEKKQFIFKSILLYFKHKYNWQPYVSVYISYEDLWNNTFKEIVKILDVIDIKVEHCCLQEAIDYFSWENQADGRRPGEQDNTSFLRSGITGAYKREFDIIDHFIYFSAFILSFTCNDFIAELGEELLAIIIPDNYCSKGIHFFTPNHFSQQLAFMSHEEGHKIIPHKHNHIKREVYFTQEVLFIKKGILRVDFYDNDNVYLKSHFL